MELNRRVLVEGVGSTRQNKPPSPTTLYHYRRALLKLGIAVRSGDRLILAQEKPTVRELLEALGDGPALGPSEREAFAQIVISNPDCQRSFFDLFMSNQHPYGLGDFLSQGQPVVWKEGEALPPTKQSATPGSLQTGKTSKGKLQRKRTILFTDLNGNFLGQIKTAIEIQATLYGVRYWARDQLFLIDEVFFEGSGNIMYPISDSPNKAQREVRAAILNRIANDEDWTTLSVPDLALNLGLTLRISRLVVFSTLLGLYRRYPGYMVLIPTARSFATITASSALREDLELRGYFQDPQGRIISHVRLHKHMKEAVYD